MQNHPRKMKVCQIERKKCSWVKANKIPRKKKEKRKEKREPTRLKTRKGCLGKKKNSKNNISKIEKNKNESEWFDHKIRC